MSMTTVVDQATTLGAARAIFARGTDFLGPEEALRVHGQLHGLEPPEKLPDLPWTEEELVITRARDEGAHLILVPPDLTMKEICEKRKNIGADNGKLLYNTDWYNREDFYTTATTGESWDWRLVTSEVIPDSAGKNYVEQTAVLTDYLEWVVFVGRPLPSVYQQAVDEFREKQGALAKPINDDWEKVEEVAKQLTALTINRLLREPPVTTFYRLVTYLEINAERLLERMYYWTPTLSSHGSLVYIGNFVRDGALVNACFPRNRFASLGVVLSRSARAETEGVAVYPQPV